MKQFRLPDPGEGLVEAEIVTWLVAEGDEVKVNDIVVEIETSKSLVELPIPYEGTVASLLVAEGQTVEVGAPIITIDDGTGDEIVDPDAEGARVANLVGYGPKEGESKRRPRKGSADSAEKSAVHEQLASSFTPEVPVSRPIDSAESLATAAGAAAVGAPLPSPGEANTEPGIATGAVLAKPPVRKLARDLGVDLSEVVGSGDGGLITREDVHAAAATAAAMAEEASALRTEGRVATLESRREPIKGIRRVMAQAMVTSAFTAPHTTEWLTFDATGMVELLELLKSRKEYRDVRVSPTLIAARVVCLALRQFPDLNASWDEAAQEIVYHGRVNLGIAAATGRGLVVPNIPDADRLSFSELSTALDDLVATARAGRTAPSAMAGGTFTITNVGVFGVDAGTPILNPGEAGILALGAIARRPWVVGSGEDERIEPRSVMTLALSFDHRMIDGATGSRFLAMIADLLANPGLALLH